MGKALNSIGNTVAVVPRGMGAWVLATLDTVRAAGNIFSDMWAVIQHTWAELKEVLMSSRNTGKWYNKLYQVPASLLVGTGVLVEGVVRTVLEPTRNAFLNVRDVTGNFFKNIGNGIGRLFDTSRPVSDFRFEHLQTKNSTGKNRMKKLARWKKAVPAPVPALVP